MPPHRHFSLFPKLPIEIQLMIWEFYTENQPIIRHCFLRETKNASTYMQYYVAFDEESRSFVDKTVDARDDTNLPTHRKVVLPYDCKPVSVERPPYTATRIRNMVQHGRRTHRKTPIQSRVTLANFDRDIFYFWGDTFDAFQCMADHTTPSLPSKYWLFSVRHLAFNTEKSGALYLSEWGNQLLARMKRLKTVYIIAEEVPGGLTSDGLSRYRDRVQHHNTPKATGLMDLEAFKSASRWVLSAERLRWASEFRGTLEKVFQNHGMKVKVEIVVDMYW
ncbi:hypothetical protein F4677DRAFT_432365 [Hypoxylon crocopeplum]|nr:hypothetical protein F4677DRAFT_432365 [Hypoxylon crocopeplum]